MPAPSYIKRGSPAIAPSTAVIPPATPSQTFNSDNLDSGESDSQIVDYESQGGMQPPPVNSPQDFISDGDDISALGIELREARRKLANGAEADGLLIVDVAGGSPAAAAGLRANKHTAHDVVEGAIAVGAVLFPPAIVAVAALEQIPFGESYDLIIGVDGTRVTNLLDFEDRMRDVRAGEIVYLSIVRNGARVQIPVQLPTTLPPPTF